MFFVGDIRGSKIGVVDTADSTIEYWGSADLQSLNVDILGFNSVSGKAEVQNTSNFVSDYEKKNLSTKLGYKLYSTCIRHSEDIVSYLSQSYIFGIHDLVYSKGFRLSGNLKMFNYSEQTGFILLALEVLVSSNQKTLLLIKVNNRGFLSSKLLGENPYNQYNWCFGLEPSGSGYLYNLRIRQTIGVNANLSENCIYMKIYYSESNYILVNTYDLTIAFISETPKIGG